MPLDKNILNDLAKNNPNLTKLEIGVMPVNGPGKIDSKETFQALIQALMKNTNLSKLKIDDFDSIDNFIKEDLEDFCKFIVQTSTLKELSFVNTWLSGNSIKLICNAVAENKSIYLLNLMGNFVDRDGAAGVSKLLENSSTLTFLNLTNCQINDGAISIVAKGLASNKSVRELKLNNNFPVTDVGIEALATALKSNKTLRQLELTGMGDHGAVCMAQALRENNSLQTLIINGSSEITDASLREFAIMLENNTTIINLQISSNPFLPTMYEIQKPLSELSRWELCGYIGSLLDRNKKKSEENVLHIQPENEGVATRRADPSIDDDGEQTVEGASPPSLGF